MSHALVPICALTAEGLGRRRSDVLYEATKRWPGCEVVGQSPTEKTDLVWDTAHQAFMPPNWPGISSTVRPEQLRSGLFYVLRLEI